MKMPNEIDFVIVLVICGLVLATAQEPNEYFNKSVKLFENIIEQLETLRNDCRTSTLNLKLQNGILHDDLMKGNADLFNAMSRYANEAKNANLTKTLNWIQTKLETRSNANTTANQDVLQVVLDEVRAIKNEQLNKTCYSISDNDTVVQSQLTEALNGVTELKKANNALVSVSNSRWKKQQKLLQNILKTISNHTNNEQQSMPGFGFSIDNSSLKLPRSCAEALERAGKDAPSGVYQVYLPLSGLNPFFVYCLRDPKGGPAWTVVQRRADNTTNFYRDWADYKVGFGHLNNEFFIGLDKLHALTQYEVQELWVYLEDFENQTRYAKYNSFAIGDKHQKYALTVLGDYEGNAGDSLRFQAGHMFSTRDRDNDISKRNCAHVFKGAWWYSHCHARQDNMSYFSITHLFIATSLIVNNGVNAAMPPSTLSATATTTTTATPAEAMTTTAFGANASAIRTAVNEVGTLSLAARTGLLGGRLPNLTSIFGGNGVGEGLLGVFGANGLLTVLLSSLLTNRAGTQSAAPVINVNTAATAAPAPATATAAATHGSGTQLTNNRYPYAYSYYNSYPYNYPYYYNAYNYYYPQYGYYYYG